MNRQNSVVAEKVDLVSELETIRKAHDGILRPVDVVEAAEDADHPLHSRFQWDDTKAGHEYRLWQARELIQVAVTLLPHCETQTRAYVSMLRDRNVEGGGYRPIGHVLANVVEAKELLAEALAELERMERRYKHLTELAEVFAAARKVRRKK